MPNKKQHVACKKSGRIFTVYENSLLFFTDKKETIVFFYPGYELIFFTGDNSTLKKQLKNFQGGILPRVKLIQTNSTEYNV